MKSKNDQFFLLFLFLLFDGVATGGSGAGSTGTVATSGSSWADGSVDGSGCAKVPAIAAGFGIEKSEASYGLIFLSMIRA